MFFKIVVFKNFANFTGKHVLESLFKKRLQPQTMLFSHGIYEIFKNTFFNRTPLMPASETTIAESFLRFILQLYRKTCYIYNFAEKRAPL